MFCPNCGREVAEGERFCGFCGRPVSSGENNNSYVNQQPFQPYEQTPEYQQPIYQQPVYQQPAGDMPGLKMGWYRFLINFALFFSAALNLLNGIQIILGLHYSGSAELVYSYYSGLQALDIAYGALLILLAAFLVFTRFQLSGYKKTGPLCLYIIYIANAVTAVVYLVIASVILGQSVVDTSNVSSLIVSAAMLVVNIVYFNKRKFMFVN